MYIEESWERRIPIVCVQESREGLSAKYFSVIYIFIFSVY